MASLETVTVDTEPKVCATASSYSWYICSFDDQIYAGCCRVDPCTQYSIGCPSTAIGEPVISSPIITSSSPSSSLIPTSTSRTDPHASPTSAETSSSASPTTDGGSSHGMTVSISAIVGIAVGCGIVVIFAALTACMWWGRRQRERDEKRQNAQRLASTLTLDDDLVPPGLESVFNPMTSNGPGSVFDRAEGRMSKASRESFRATRSSVHDSYMSTAGQFGLVGPLMNPSIRDSHSSGATSHHLSPIPPNNRRSLRCSSIAPSELDSAPIAELPAAPEPQPRTGSNVDSTPTTKQQTTESHMVEGPRATLNSTQQEREAGTYANS